MSVQSILRWRDGVLDPLDYCDMTDARVIVADSWVVDDGLVLGLDLHRDRFLGSFPAAARGLDVEGFWAAVIAAIPRSGVWFPRVELHAVGDAWRLLMRLREAPERRRSAVLAAWDGPDPRRSPLIKGPDLDRLAAVRTAVQPLGADEAVLVTPDGAVIEGAYSALLWWRGDILCAPPREFARIPSVTARVVLTLATALGVDTHEEPVLPRDLDGTETWVLSALHGIRIATSWVEGPGLAERPGRLGDWRARLSALRRPLSSAASDAP